MPPWEGLGSPQGPEDTETLAKGLQSSCLGWAQLPTKSGPPMEGFEVVSGAPVTSSCDHPPPPALHNRMIFFNPIRFLNSERPLPLAGDSCFLSPRPPPPPYLPDQGLPSLIGDENPPPQTLVVGSVAAGGAGAADGRVLSGVWGDQSGGEGNAPEPGTKYWGSEKMLSIHR